MVGTRCWVCWVALRNYRRGLKCRRLEQQGGTRGLTPTIILKPLEGLGSRFRSTNNRWAQVENGGALKSLVGRLEEE